MIFIINKMIFNKMHQLIIKVKADFYMLIIKSVVFRLIFKMGKMILQFLIIFNLILHLTTKNLMISNKQS